jgi:hypothetical protein
VQGLLRLGITLFAFVFLLGFLLLGLAAASALVAWALIRGQKPAAGVFRDRFERARGRPHRASQADVVDAEVREVPEAERRLPAVQASVETPTARPKEAAEANVETPSLERSA